MPIAQALVSFNDAANQCESLIANAHQQDVNGQYLLPAPDRRQITVAALLNLFIAWESFLEEILSHFMTGVPTLNGTHPPKFVSPASQDAAKAMLMGTQRYFDYGNHDFFRKIVGIYFVNGYPFEPHFTSLIADLGDIRTLRNSSAHITSSTQAALDGLYLRIFGTPANPSADLYSMLLAVDPRSAAGNTLFAEFKAKLTVVGQLIATG